MSQTSATSSSFSVTCPGCGQRLRFSLGAEVPARVRIQCSACQTAFTVRRPGAEVPAASLTGTAAPPTYVGVPVASTPPPARPQPPAAPPVSVSVSAGGGSAPPRRRFGEAAFVPGEVIAGRYEVVRFIARGGMGEVYEVEDRELRERVALKTVRSEVARDTVAIERFKREIQLARKVTHPNVCRIFDVSHHRFEGPAGGEGESLIFLTMELLPGETLADRIRREGKMTPETALPVVRQVAEALYAAHQAGVVHRDLKPGNVLLIEGRGGATGSGTPRAVVTDFGLARLEGGAESGGMPALTMTSAGVIGTPAYLAPEQVDGTEITAAVDIYSLGIVLYEMLTGTVPFVGETALMTAVKRLREAPPSPRVHTPGLDPRWEAVILRCLEREPASRFPDAREVARALAPESPLLPLPAAAPAPTAAFPSPAPATPAEPAQPAGPAGRTAARKKETGRRRLQIAGLAAVILLSIGIAAYRVREWKAEQAAAEGLLLPPTLEQVRLRPSVAVLGFKNLTGAPGTEWLSAGLAEMLATELGTAGDLRVVSGENVARMKTDLGLGFTDALAPDTLERVRRNLSADAVVLGSFSTLQGPAGRRIRLDVHLQRTGEAAPGNAGETRIAETGAEAELFDLVARAGQRLRQQMGMGAARQAATAARASLAASPQAAKLYAEGLQRLRKFDPAGARDLLQRAVEADPGSALGHSALSAAWAALGYDGKAAAEAKTAFDLSAALPEEERLLIEGRYRESTQEWSQAVQTYWKLWSLFPDDLDHGLRLAAAQTSAGQAEEALSTLEALRSLPPPLRDDPRIDLAEAMAAGAQANFRRQEAAASRAAKRSEEEKAPLMTAQARLLECRALRNLGRADKALAACEEGRRLHAGRGDRAGAAEALTHSANVLYDQGDLAAARVRYEEALAVYRDIGSKGGEAGALNNLAVVLKSQGELDEARSIYERVLALAREIGSRNGEAYALNNLAGVLVLRGKLDEAGKLYEEALAVRRQMGDRAGEAAALDNLGVALRRQGDLAGARRRHEEALRIRRDIGQKISEAASLNNLGQVLLAQGDLAAARGQFQQALETSRQAGNASATAAALFGLGEVLARQGNVAEARPRHEEGLQMRTRQGERGTAAESRLALAALALQEGDRARAGDLARFAAEELGRQGARASQALALANLALAEVSEKSGKAAARQAEALLEENQDLPARLGVEIRTARFLKPAEGESRLREIVEQATKAGLVEIRLEAALALANAETARGKAADARARLAATEEEARSRGYALAFLRAGR